jgi:putative Holliday junction resolvase
MRILGLDYGDKRIGVAVCDELGMTTRGIATVVRKYWKRDVERIAALVREYGAERVVVGYPVRLDGTVGVQCEKVDGFIEVLAADIDIPVVKWNEALSTKEAEGLLREAEVSHKKRRAVVDRMAAAIILQDYLDHNPPPAGGDFPNTRHRRD